MDNNLINSKPYRVSRVLYILEAALEYFISILVAGSYLATLTEYIGISDSVTGVISAFISLGCVFQLMSVFLKKGRIKSVVVPLSVLNQLMFMLLYVIPLTGMGDGAKKLVFVAMIFSAYFVYNSIHPLKIGWLMSLVEDKRRGIFTSRKEIVSLISGMIFTYITGAVIDHYKDNGQIETAFLICGAAIFVLTVLHTLTMVFSVENTEKSEGAQENSGKNPVGQMMSVMRDKSVLKVIVLFVLWNIAVYAATPFYGTYQIKELGFSMKFVSLLAIVYSIVRASVSTFWGKYADRRSFAVMVRACFVIAGTGFFVNIFTVPSNGAIMYTLYYALYAVAWGGISSALINLVFDFAKPDERSNALAVTQAASGLVGFFTTLAVSPLVEYIQASGNRLFGMNIYAQQAVSAIAFLFTAVAVVYLSVKIIPKKEK